MNREEATLIAALIAAGASAFTVATNLRAQKSAELRASYRESLEPHISELGEALHEIVAATNIYLFKARSDESRGKWRQKHENARDRIKERRTKVRYQLWGIDDGIRIISRVGDHSTHLTDDEPRANRLIKAATTLRKKLDRVIMKCYQRGSAPTLLESWSVRMAAKKVSSVFNEYSPKNDEDA
jgi:hypothetical protein